MKEKNCPLISIILPSLNEEASIRKVISEINNLQISNKEILVIDGYSTDATIKLAKKSGAKVIIEPKKGYGSAIQKGINSSKGKIIVIMDSDFTYPARYISQLIDPLVKNEADLVIGNRLEKIAEGSMRASHLIGNLFLTIMFNIFFRSRIKDTQTGFRAFKKEIFEKMSLKSKGIFLPTEILIKALKLHLRISEKPINYRPRIGKSKLSPIRDGFIILAQMIKDRISSNQ